MTKHLKTVKEKLETRLRKLAKTDGIVVKKSSVSYKGKKLFLLMKAKFCMVG